MSHLDLTCHDYSSVVYIGIMIVFVIVVYLSWKCAQGDMPAPPWELHKTIRSVTLFMYIDIYEWKWYGVGEGLVLIFGHVINAFSEIAYCTSPSFCLYFSFSRPSYLTWLWCENLILITDIPLLLSYCCFPWLWQMYLKFFAIFSKQLFSAFWQ